MNAPHFRLEDLRLFLARSGDEPGRTRHIIHLSRIGPESRFAGMPLLGPALVFAGPGGLPESTTRDLNAGRGLAISFTDEFYCLNEHDRSMLTSSGLFTDEPYLRELSPQEARDIQDILQLMKREFRGDGPRRGELLRSYLGLLLLKAAPPAQAGSPDQKRLREFHELLETHFTRKHRPSDYADMLFVSGKCLSELTRRHLGKTPGEVIQERLMREARRLLQSGEFNVAATARELGFRDPHYFSRFFKRHAGRPAGEFLAEHQAGK